MIKKCREVSLPLCAYRYRIISRYLVLSLSFSRSCICSLSPYLVFSFIRSLSPSFSHRRSFYLSCSPSRFLALVLSFSFSSSFIPSSFVISSFFPPSRLPSLVPSLLYILSWLSLCSHFRSLILSHLVLVSLVLFVCPPSFSLFCPYPLGSLFVSLSFAYPLTSRFSFSRSSFVLVSLVLVSFYFRSSLFVLFSRYQHACVQVSTANLC